MQIKHNDHDLLLIGNLLSISLIWFIIYCTWLIIMPVTRSTHSHQVLEADDRKLGGIKPVV
jgi:hypothetical protein